MGRRMKERITRTCLFCGTLFITGGAAGDDTKVYCSRKCYLKSIEVKKENRTCPRCGKMFIAYTTNDKRYCSLACSSKGNQNGFRKGHYRLQTVKEREKRSKSMMGNKNGKGRPKGYKHTTEWRLRMSEMKRGTNAPSYIDGKGRERANKRNQEWRYNTHYQMWREGVFKRDNYRCQICGEKGRYLQAHHIVMVKDNEDLKYDIDNGVTVCAEHHWSFYHRKGGLLRTK